MEQWQQEEWYKCYKDFRYFAKNYLRVSHPEKGLVPFVLYPFQERVLENYENNRFNILSKFRQAGLTTLTVLYMLWKCMFRTDQLVLVMSKTDREAIKAGRTVTKALQFIEHNHPWLYPQLSTNTHHEKNFIGTGSFLEFRTIKAARGQSLTYIVIDEAAFIQGMEDAWKDMYPTISAGGNVIVVSTVNGMGNWYQQMYHDAVNKKNRFNVIEIDYTEHPEYCKPEWIQNTKANLSPRDWAQEFEKNFLNSGNSFFNIESLTRIDKRTKETFPKNKLFAEWDSDKLQFGDQLPQELNEHWNKGALWIWEPPIDGHDYIIGVDCAEGLGEDGDNSAFEIIDVNTLVQVAEFSSNCIPSNLLASILNEIGSAYNTALIVVETNSSGQVVLDKLVNNLYYENIYFQLNRATEKPGLTIGNSNIRGVILDNLREYIENDRIKVNSSRFTMEMNTFVFDRSKKKALAQKGHHDDMIMAMGIALHVRDKISRNLPVGVPSNLVETEHMSYAYEKIRKEINSITPEDLLKKNEAEKLNWERNDINSAVYLPVYRPFNNLLKEFGW